ncbi:response regulator [Thermoleptolyngbya sp. C42_A2020_037]|uniref:response regulator n=1 Tax=Thermoleptolyngbya sp. C42_A2020_037 TaxID=2747799 RepID=UPI001A0FCE4E|nr:response regulator [Thermoleptolyngbya sp. C42_A2020_037]MBF2085028.1 response regulator [Thermoleptolyngbya sp. C42_A2020_037]
MTLTLTNLTKTILVVEDTPSEMELMSHYLRESGCTVINAVTAKEAMEKAIQHRPDVIVTDVVMPGMSGFELCRSLKKQPETSKVPIVICTSKNQEIDRLWGMKQGADAYLTKPYTREQLLRAVMSVVGVGL